MDYQTTTSTAAPPAASAAEEEEDLPPQLEIKKRRRRRRVKPDNNNSATVNGKRRKKKRVLDPAYLSEFCNDDDTPRFATSTEENEEEVVEVLLEPPPRKPLPLLLLQRELGMSGVTNIRRRKVPGYKRKKDLPPHKIIQTKLTGGRRRRLEERFPHLQRDLGYSRSWNPLRWQYQMLYHSLEEDNKPVTISNRNPRKGWRPYLQQQQRSKVAFTKLETPGDAAILAIDRQGTYSIALTAGSGENDDNDDDMMINTDTNAVAAASSVPSDLSLCFFGIPSPSILEKAEKESSRKRERRRDISPLLSNVALLSSGISSRGSTARFQSLTAPINVLISGDWKLGVAFISTRQGREGTTATTADGSSIVIFSLPRKSRPVTEEGVAPAVVQTLRASCIRMPPLQSLSTPRSLLWKVHQIPLIKLPLGGLGKGWLCNFVMDRSGHLLFVDEGNGFRLTWITDSLWREDNGSVKILKSISSLTSVPPARSIVSPVTSEQCVWKETFNDSHTGRTTATIHKDPSPGLLKVTFEAFLDVPLLLGELLRAHSGMAKHLSDNPYPPHVYNVVSVGEMGRTVDLFIVWSFKSAGYGVFVTLDLFTQHYRSNGWMKNNNTTNLKELRNVCNFFALNHRMKQRKLGPYSVDSNDPWMWSATLCLEQFSYEFEMERDLDPAQWKPFAHTASKVRERKGVFGVRKANPKGIPYSMLYPDCELITNRNLRTETPVLELKGMKSHVKLVYC